MPAPDVHHFDAAQGWLGLRNAAEAFAELARIRPELQSHPVVRAAWLDAWIANGDWARAREAAQALCGEFPDEPGFWLHLAYATRRAAAAGGLEAAELILRGVEAQFPKQWVIPFNRACYYCQMGQLADAKGCLARALEVGGARIRRQALEDEDLKPLWPMLTRMGRETG